jgi:hypothetical protein
VRNPNAVEGYRRAIKARGDIKVILRRVTGNAPNNSTLIAKVGAIMMDYIAETPIGGGGTVEAAITIGGRRVIVLADDLRKARFPLAVLKNDQVIINPNPAQLGNGSTKGDEALNVISVDPNKRRIAGAIELIAQGK